MPDQAGTLYVVATPIGNLEDLSPRAQRLLAEVNWIAAEDTRHSRRLLEHFGISTPMTALHDHNEREVTAGLVERIAGGDNAALISDAGTPLISDPGYRLVGTAAQRGLAVVPVPGPSALLAALSVSGLATDRFAFEGFPPRGRAARDAWLQALADDMRTLVFYESPHRVVECLAAMRSAFGAGREAVVARELTKRYEEIRRGSLGELADAFARGDIRTQGEFVLVVAGAEIRERETPDLGVERLLAELLKELPPRRAAAVAARLGFGKANELYRLATGLNGRG